MNCDTSSDPPQSPMNNDIRRRRSSSVSFSSAMASNAPSLVHSPVMSPHSPDSGATPNRRRSSMIRATFRLTRDTFYRQFASASVGGSGVSDDSGDAPAGALASDQVAGDGGNVAAEGPHQAPGDLTFCANQLCSVALALTALLCNEGRVTRATLVTVEDIFHTVKLPLHYTSRPSLTMHEVYCILSEFISVDPRFAEYTLRMSTIDVRRVDNDTAETSTSESCPRQHSITVSDLRTELMRDVINSSRQTLLFYDAFTLLQNVALEVDEDENAAERSLESSALLNSMLASSMQKRPSNRLAIEARTRCTLVKDVNPTHLVVHMVQGGLSQTRNRLRATDIDAPLTALHTAMAARDAETGRAHGFIVIEKDGESEGSSADEEMASSTLLKSPHRSFRLANRVLDTTFSQSLVRFPVKCTPTSVPLLFLGHRIASHVTALALAGYLMRRTENIDVNSVVQGLTLPIEVVRSNSMTAAQVLPYYREHLKRLGLSTTYIPLIRKSRRVGAPSTLSATDLANLFAGAVNSQSFLDDSAATAVIMSYDANVVHGCISVGFPEEPSVGYGILAGFDATTEKVLIIDPQPRQFTQYWEVPVDRLHQAMSDHGLFIVTAGDAAAERAASYIPHHEVSFTEKALHSIVDIVPQPTMTNEESLGLDVALVLGAIALTRLGQPVTLDTIIHRAPCNVSHLLQSQLSIEDYARTLNWINAGRGNLVAQCHHVESVGRVSPVSVDFISEVTRLHDSGAPVIFSFATRAGSVPTVPAPQVSVFALLLEIRNGNALLLETNRDPAQRRKWMRLEALHAACHEVCSVTHRSRGFITFVVDAARAAVYASRPLADAFAIPHATPFSPSLCPSLTAASIALRTIGISASAEEILYTVFDSRDVRDEAQFTTLRRQLEATSTANVLNAFLGSQHPGIVAEVIEPSSFSIAALKDGLTKHSQRLIVIYDPRDKHGVSFSGMGAAVISRVSDDGASLVMCDAEPSCWPDYWLCDTETFMRHVAKANCGVVRVYAQ